MEPVYEVLPNIPVDHDNNTLKGPDTSECFICRDVELHGQANLGHFCDCKTLVAHHHCLLTWIKKGLGGEKRPRCSVCHAEYQLLSRSPWRSVMGQWQAWLVLGLTAALLGLVPYSVFRMMTAYQNPPPHSLFKAAAICFGLLSETLLVKCFVAYCSRRYRKAELSSFSVQPRPWETGYAS